jgi:hypothetical protein
MRSQSIGAPTPRGLSWRAVAVAVSLSVALLAAVALVVLLRDTLDPIERARRAELEAGLGGVNAVTTALWRLLPPLLILAVATVALAIAWRRYGQQSSVAADKQAELTRAERQIFPSALTSLSYHNAPHIASTNGPLSPLVEIGTSSLPTAPALAEILAGGFQPTIDRVLLGYTAEGPIYGPVSALLSTAIAGRPNQGKSTLLRLVYAQLLRAGGAVAIYDPHGSILDDVGNAPARLIASSGKELDDAAAWLDSELEQRLGLYRKGHRTFQPLLNLCDEFPVISLASPTLVKAAGRVVLEGRKVGMYALISGQGLPAEQFNGRLVRDALSSRYVFKTSAAEARRAGLSGDAAKLVESLSPGRAMLDGPILPTIVAIPNTTATDLVGLTPGLNQGCARADQGRPMGFHLSANQPTISPNSSQIHPTPSSQNNASGSGVSHSPEEARIVSLFLAGKDAGEIVTELTGMQSKAGKPYQVKLREVQEVIRAAFQAANGAQP